MARPKPLAFGFSAAIASAIAMAAPTAVLANPLFSRMTPVRTQDYIFLAIGSVLIGLIAATYAVPGASSACQTQTLGSGLLNVLAIGCPVCNKIVVLLLGFSGALTIWAPLQPVLGLAALALMAWTLRVRLRSILPPHATAGA